MTRTQGTPYVVGKGAGKISDANRLGLDYRVEAGRLPWRGAIWDVHTHIRDVAAGRVYFQAAEWFGLERVWSMSPLEEVDALRAEFGERIQFIAVPNYYAEDWEEAMGRDWLRRIEGFAAKGVKVCKFWGAPRGLDKTAKMWLDSPTRLESMRLARSLGMTFMVHVADPDTWFATKYADARKYGSKGLHYEKFERLLDQFSDVPWLAAHMAGHPEDLDHLQGLLERHGNLYLDTSATKWMVRELSKRADEFGDFCRRNPGRILFGTDIVAEQGSMSLDLFASRFWCLRALLETRYDGPSPVVDPDLAMVDPKQPKDATAHLRGAGLEEAVLGDLYLRAAEGLRGFGQA
ncbi:MAG: amidohydrolase family protein [Phycisphaeraceae bacterium]|nr:amidohydrolase family protein [Phycisphaeraceae bacterium]